MKRIWPVIIILAAALLAACGGAGQSPVNTAAPAASATPVPATTAPNPTTPPQPTATPIPTGCQVTSILPSWDPIFPPVTTSDWQKGSKDALVTIIEYSDFQCPYCGQIVPVLNSLLKSNPQDLRVIYRHFPLNIHDKAIITAQAAEAAGVQGKFWEMHDLLFGSQADWSKQTPAEFVPYITDKAKSISGLDIAKFTQDLNSQAVVDKVKTALSSAESIGLDHTPFIVFNGRAFGGDPDEATLNEIINIYKAVTTTIGPIKSAQCPPQSIDAKKQYTATITTTKGDVAVKLFADKAPLAVNSFIYLAKRGWYNNVPFHRVIENFVAQTGDPSGTGLGNPGYEFNNEVSPDLKFDKEGMLGLANSGANTNGSQFFITFAAIPTLDGSYTAFGQVTSGMDVLKKLTLRDPQFGAAKLPDPDKILKISIEEK
jgi:cyclophilin family peptidyl-prolyl cis-trans isomerase/predicted DsbA family dithiol-disulfide isomerase